MYKPKQGDIIRINLNPVKGHEQQGESRPAVVISNDYFNTMTKLTVVCPITNTNKHFPLHIELDERTKTTGVVLCEHFKSLDCTARDIKFIEKIPDDTLQKIINIVHSEIEFQ